MAGSMLSAGARIWFAMGPSDPLPKDDGGPSVLRFSRLVLRRESLAHLGGEVAAAQEAATAAEQGQTVALGALVVVGEEGHRLSYFVVSLGGGETLAGGTVQVVTPRSLLGVALVTGLRPQRRGAYPCAMHTHR